MSQQPTDKPASEDKDVIEDKPDTPAESEQPGDISKKEMYDVRPTISSLFANGRSNVNFVNDEICGR